MISGALGAATISGSRNAGRIARLPDRHDLASARLEAGGDDGDLDLPRRALVDHGAEDHVRVLSRFLADDRGRLVFRGSVIVSPPVMLTSTPFAPLIDTALRAEGSEDRHLCRFDRLFSPFDLPVPMRASPMPAMIERTSAKSRFMRPGVKNKGWKRPSSRAGCLVGHREGLGERRARPDDREEARRSG